MARVRLAEPKAPLPPQVQNTPALLAMHKAVIKGADEWDEDDSKRRGVAGKRCVCVRGLRQVQGVIEVVDQLNNTVAIYDSVKGDIFVRPTWDLVSFDGLNNEVPKKNTTLEDIVSSSFHRVHTIDEGAVLGEGEQLTADSLAAEPSTQLLIGPVLVDESALEDSGVRAVGSALGQLSKEKAPKKKKGKRSEVGLEGSSEKGTEDAELGRQFIQ